MHQEGNATTHAMLEHWSHHHGTQQVESGTEFIVQPLLVGACHGLHAKRSFNDLPYQ